jgi:hypothetical protein
MALDATVGGESANSYVDLTEANEYMAGRLHTEPWKTGSVVKEKALRQAARILDRYVEWRGVKTDEAQAMQWPRQYVPDPDYRTVDALDFYIDAGDYFIPKDEIPQRMKDAQCELALHLLSQDTQAVPDTAGYSQIDVEGAVSLSVDKADRTDVIPRHVWLMVHKFGQRHGNKSVKLERS